MIRDEQCALNIDLAAMLRSLHREMRRGDHEAIVGVTRNLAYVLKQTTRLQDMRYNAFEISVAIAVGRKDLPEVSRDIDIYRPHQYVQDIETIAQQGVARLDLVVPVPLEFADEDLPYALSLKMYPTEDRVSIPGLTVNVGQRI